MIEIINTQKEKKLIYRYKIVKATSKRQTKNGVLHNTYYFATLPASIREYLGVTNAVYMVEENQKVYLTNNPTGERYSIRKKNISIPMKFFNPAGFSHVVYEVDLSRVDAGVIMRLE